MAAKFDFGPDDDGFIEVALPGGSVTLDLYRANNTYLALSDAHPDPVELAREWGEWLRTQGLPPMSDRKAFGLADAVLVEVARLKKSDGGPAAGPPASCDSTGPGPSPDCPDPAPSAT